MSSTAAASGVFTGRWNFNHSALLFLLKLFGLGFIVFTDGTTAVAVDPNGYVAYCPCMGRLGNQADQFLGSLAFAKRINRTLILPPWIEYVPYQTGSLQIPFDTYFKPDSIAPYHRVIRMEYFMEVLAPTVWPEEKRISFCFAERGEGRGCNAKDGNPFGPFWDNFNITFAKSEIFGPDLHYTRLGYETGTSWSKYSGDQWPVLAFVGPPSIFPVERTNVPLHQYLIWSDEIEEKAKKFIATLPKGPFIGIHLRNGLDWARACELVHESKELFSSPQCTGYRNENGPLMFEMCLPSANIIKEQLKVAIEKTAATSVFIASDSNHMLEELKSSLKNSKVSLHTLPYSSPHVDLAVLGKSNLYIGNCVSSFSAFVKRERDVHGFMSEFWAFPPLEHKHVNKRNSHQEL